MKNEIDFDSARIREFAGNIRLHAIRMISQSGASHLGGNFSMAEIVAVLYGAILHVDPKNPSSPNRDHFVLSKGHAAAGLYAALAEKGFFPMEWLDSFYGDGAKLSGHITKHIPGIDISTGSLGHGLSIGTGFALAGKKSGRSYRSFVLLSDGECNEGSTWEAVMFAAQHRLDNLVSIVDYNKMQALGPTAEIIDMEPFVEKWESFGWETQEVDGHDVAQLFNVLSKIPLQNGKPTCVIAHTIKGKGVSFMENELLWHYRTPKGKEYETAIEELKRNP